MNRDKKATAPPPQVRGEGLVALFIHSPPNPHHSSPDPFLYTN